MHIKSRKLRDCQGLYDVNLMDKQKTISVKHGNNRKTVYGAEEEIYELFWWLKERSTVYNLFGVMQHNHLSPEKSNSATKNNI